MSHMLGNVAGGSPNSAFDAWLACVAGGLDTGVEPASAVLPRLAVGGLAAAGVPSQRGGSGGDIVDGVVAVSAVAQQSLTAAFVLWGHRTYIEYLLQSPMRGRPVGFKWEFGKIRWRFESGHAFGLCMRLHAAGPDGFRE